MKVRPRYPLGQLSDMDIRLLRVFKSVVDCGGMAAAELELNIGISTISRHVKDLEVRLGLTLCRRGRSGFSLTPEGQKVYEQTLALLAATDSFRTGVDEIHQRLRGDLSVALFDKISSNPDAHVDQAIALFCDRAPDVNLNVYIAPINTIEQGLINGQFQVGVLPGHGRSSPLDYRRLFGERMQLYCGTGHPLFESPMQTLTWNDLRQHRFAGLGYHSPNMALSLQRRITRSATAFDQEGIATLILSGRYIGFLPDHYAHNFVVQGKMHALSPDTLQYSCDFFSVIRRSPQAARTTHLFLECLGRSHSA